MPIDVSIITRTKDRPLLLKRAMDSVLGQLEFSNWEHIIVNDAGDAQPVHHLFREREHAYQNRCRILTLDHSKGMENASNCGIKASSGKFLIIHDDDDSWNPHFLSRMTSCLKTCHEQTAGVVCHSMRIVEEINGNEVIEHHRHPFNSDLQEISLWRTLKENCFPPISFLFRRKAFDQVGEFDQSLPVLGDWEFNLRILLQYQLRVLPEILANYHHRTSSSLNAYANSVTDGHQQHQKWDAILRERWQKDGIGPVGKEFGSLAMIGKHSLAIDRTLDRMKDRIISLPSPPPTQQ